MASSSSTRITDDVTEVTKAIERAKADSPILFQSDSLYTHIDVRSLKKKCSLDKFSIKFNSIQAGDPTACRDFLVHYYQAHRDKRYSASLIKAAVTLGWEDGEYDYQWYSTLNTYDGSKGERFNWTAERFEIEANSFNLQQNSSSKGRISTAFFLVRAARKTTADGCSLVFAEHKKELAEKTVNYIERAIQNMLQAGVSSPEFLNSLKLLLNHFYLENLHDKDHVGRLFFAYNLYTSHLSHSYIDAASYDTRALYIPPAYLQLYHEANPTDVVTPLRRALKEGHESTVRMIVTSCAQKFQLGDSKTEPHQDVLDCVAKLFLTPDKDNIHSALENLIRLRRDKIVSTFTGGISWEALPSVIPHTFLGESKLTPEDKKKEELTRNMKM